MCRPAATSSPRRGPASCRRNSAAFDVRADDVAQVLLDIQLTFVMPDVEVRARDAVADRQRAAGVDERHARPARCSRSRRSKATTSRACCRCCRASCAGPTGACASRAASRRQGALQISSASLIDPSTGDFDLDLPGQSVESVEVLANPFAAEYGRFSTSVTQIRTRRGTNDWEIKPGNLMPRFRKSFSGMRGFEPRFSIRGPIRHDRAFIAQDFQFRYVATPVKSLPDEPEIELKSFDSFTRVDTVVSARHTLGGGLIAFPREIERATMSTFRPPEVTPDFNQSGLADRHRRPAGAGARRRPRDDAVGPAVRDQRQHRRPAPMVYRAADRRAAASSTIRSARSRSFQWVEALSLTRDWRGQHVFKFGTDLQRSRVHRLQRQPAGRGPAARRLARRADRVRRSHASRMSAASSSPCSRRIGGASARG